MLPDNFFISEKYKMIIITDNTIPPRQSLNCNFLSLNKKIVSNERAIDKPVSTINRKVELPLRKAFSTMLFTTLVPEKKGSQ